MFNTQLERIEKFSTEFSTEITIPSFDPRRSIEDKNNSNRGKSLVTTRPTIRKVNPKKYGKTPQNETIKEWWKGSVLDVNWIDQFFVAELTDLNNIRSIAEFYIREAFEDDELAKIYIYEGAEFAFYVYTVHGLGSPKTVSEIEFSEPYIWTNNDNEKVKKLSKEMFPFIFDSEENI